MLKIKSLIKYLITLFVAVIILPSTAYAAHAVWFDVSYDSGNGRYLIYTNDVYGSACEFAFTATATPAPAAGAYYPCHTDIPEGRNVIIVDATAGVPNGSPLYLWTKGAANPVNNVSGEAVNYSNALRSDLVLDLVKSTGKRIAVLEMMAQPEYGEEEVNALKVLPASLQAYAIENGLTYYGYSYTLVKVTGNPIHGGRYELLKNNALALGGIAEEDPVTGIITQSAFLDHYTFLLPKVSTDFVTETRLNSLAWVPLVADANGDLMIYEPWEKTDDGDYYVVWIRAYTNASHTTYVEDMQIMLCEKDIIQEQIERLPQTGVNYFLEATFGVTVILLSAAYLRRRKLVQEING